MIFAANRSALRVRSCENDIDPGWKTRPTTAMHLDFSDYVGAVPRHDHRHGQLVLALHGAVTCTMPDGLWIAPPQSAVWIPGGVPHSNQVTPNARLVYLFVEPGMAALPPECCTVTVSPMVREMVLRLAGAPDEDPADEHFQRLVRVMLDELARSPRNMRNLPTSDHPKIAAVTAALAAEPGDRRPLPAWAASVAMSERSFKRLMIQETGLSFGRWRRQLRIMIAQRELASGATVQQVASTLGYESVTAFIVMFKKALGVTPSRYAVDWSTAATPASR